MTDNKKDINCPACGCEMKKIFVSDANIDVDICLDGCGGIFFDNRELSKFDELNENANDILNAVNDKTFKKVDESKVRRCPICNIPMVKMGAGSGDVEIDSCNVCGAKFLDNGELQRIRERVKTNDERTEKIEELANALYKANLHNVLGDKADEDIESSPRRQFFENLVKSYLLK